MREPGEGRGVRRVAGEVTPLAGVGFVVVELLAAILVADQAPSVVSDAVVLVIERRHDGTGGAGRVGEQGDEALAVEVRFRRQAAQVDQGGEEVEQADGPLATASSLHLPDALAHGRGRRHDEQRHAGRAFPAGPLAPVLLLSQVPAVVAPEDDRGRVAVRAAVQRVEEPADLGVDE